jgi:hypothetical protein
MQITRTIAVLGLFTAGIVAACSDSGPFQPDAPKPLLGSTGTTAKDTAGHNPPDTSHHTPPDTGSHTGPDTVGAGKQNFDPRNIVGVVKGIGTYPDTANYVAIAGATIVLTTLDDSVAGIPGKELARAVSGSDGSFTLGAFKPGPYMASVTPPAGSPFRGLRWGFIITPFAPATFPLGVWINSK